MKNFMGYIKKEIIPFVKANDTLFLVSGLFIFGLLLSENPDLMLGSKLRNNTANQVLPTATVIPTDIQTPTDLPPTPTSLPRTPTSTFIPVVSSPKQTEDDWGKTIKLNEKTSASRFAPDNHMSTVDELNQAMNQYRQAHGLSTLNPHSTLCYIAQSRANELQQLGRLDSHVGAEKYMYQQQDFNTIDEVLFGGVQPVAGVHIVEWGWDKSLTGHQEAISDPRWHDGCAGIAGFFAVFEFGAN